MIEEEKKASNRANQKKYYEDHKEDRKAQMREYGKNHRKPKPDRRELFDDCGHTQIPLTQGKVALVDPDVFDEVNRYKWYASKCGTHNIRFYARRHIYVDGNRTTERMHRYIWFLKMGECPEEIDHINHDGLDCRFANLRLANRSQNIGNANTHKTPGKSSKYKGVSLHKRDQKWQAKIMKDREGEYLGIFDSEVEAARAYDRAAIEFFEEFACLNFPRINYEYAQPTSEATT